MPKGSGDSKDPTVFVSEVLAEAMSEVLTNPPPLDRAHCSFGPKPVVGANLPKALCCYLHCYHDWELSFRWAKQHKLKFKGNMLAKKHATFNMVKQALYQEGIQFHLLYPVHLSHVKGRKPHL